MNDLLVTELQESDRNWVKSFIKSHWSSEIVVAKGRVICRDELDGLQLSREKSQSAC